ARALHVLRGRGKDASGEGEARKSESQHDAPYLAEAAAATSGRGNQQRAYFHIQRSHLPSASSFEMRLRKKNLSQKSFEEEAGGEPIPWPAVHLAPGVASRELSEQRGRIFGNGRSRRGCADWLSRGGRRAESRGRCRPKCEKGRRHQLWEESIMKAMKVLAMHTPVFSSRVNRRSDRHRSRDGFRRRRADESRVPSAPRSASGWPDGSGRRGMHPIRAGFPHPMAGLRRRPVAWCRQSPACRRKRSASPT